ncbi:MAG: YqhA family protein [Methanoregula sp.]|uniref:YqhA family protein n=1 Tax=Methanoregula sp. TaxID=2052170 RepID=UPI003BB12913
MDIIKTFISLRYISIIAVISSFIGAVLLFILGALKIAGAVGVMLLGGDPVHLLIEAHGAESATSGVVILVINAIDCFLFALILLIFSYGIYTLFINSDFLQAGSYPAWIRINSIGQLKLYLTEVVITILFVQFLEIVIVNGDHLLDWQAIILPVAILCLAGAIYLMQAGHTDEDKTRKS